MSKRFKRLLALMMTLVMMLPVHSMVGFAAEAEESAVVTEDEVVTENSSSTWRLADPSNIQVGRNYLIVSNYGALVNRMATIPYPVEGMSSVPGMAVAPVTIEDDQVVSEVTPEMIWQFGEGTNNATAVDGLGEGVGFHIRNNAPGEGADIHPLRREPSFNLLAAPINTSNAGLNANQQSVMLYVLDADAATVALYYYGGIGAAAWSFVLTGRADGFTGIGGTYPTAAALRALLATAPLRLYEEYVSGDRHYIMSTSGINGTITPTSVTGHVWVEAGEDITFTFNPTFGYEVDVVTVNDEPVTVVDNSYTFTNVTANHAIHVTFRPRADATTLDFIVFNDMFPAGEFTTAVIIDLGEGRAANLNDLDPSLFTVSARNTRLDGMAVTFDGTRAISRVYVNTEPAVLGYSSPMPGSADLVTDTPASGRYIIIELVFWGPSGGAIYGGATADGSNSTILNYRINLTAPLPLANAPALMAVFEQAGVVSPVVDKFVPSSAGNVNFTISIDESYQEKGPLPLFIYFHGGGRGSDRFAPLRTANGAAMLAQMQLDNPGVYSSHIMAMQNFGNSVVNRASLIEYVTELGEQGLVDMNRIYMSGFSAGSGNTYHFIRNHPYFVAAAIPIAGTGAIISDAELTANPEIAEVAIWHHVHRADNNNNVAPNLIAFFSEGGLGTSGRFNNINGTILETNKAFCFPHFGFDWTPHESEAAVFGNKIGAMDVFMSYVTFGEFADYADMHIFDWLFAQSKLDSDYGTLVSIPAITPVDGIPYGRPVAVAAGPNAVWTLGNFLPGQIPIMTTAGRIMADVNWVINTTAITPDMYSPAVFVPQTFNVSGTVVLPDNIDNVGDVSLEVTIQVTVDGGQKVDVPWTAVRPDIDDGWDNATTIFVENYIRRTASHPGMPADPFAPTATAEADLLWGDENLYVRVRVTDDNISTVGGNHTVDGAEIFLSEAAFRGAQIGTQAHQMNQYRLSSTGIFTIRWNSAQTGIIGSEAWRRVARDTDIGYDVFMAIPLLYNHGPVDGTTMLFDIMLNDATLPATTRTAEISWNDPSWGGFSNSHGWGEITLVRDGDVRPSIVATSGHNGSIYPATLSGRLWLDYGANQTFTFTPAFGFVVDTVLVNGEPVTVTGNTFTFTNVTADHTIHVTFRPDAASVGIPFIVYNDIFAASGLVPFVYTTAVIIDLGEGNSVNLADISEDMFIVSATNTRLDGTTVVFDGERKITRAYVNTEPVPLGYIDPAPGSPDLVTDTPAAGRYIILELAFFGPDGPILDARADDGPNSTMLNYRINVNRNLTYQVGGATQSIIPRFEQEQVVTPALDRFVPDRTNPDGPGDVRILIAIHEAYQEVGPLPLFVYHHGGGRGGPAGEADRFAPLMTLSGAAVLSKLQLEHPGRFDAHLIATQGHANNEANRQAFIAYVEGLVEAGKVDPNRIYMSGFSLGSGNTFGFLVNNPEFLAAIIPIGGGTMPTQAQIDANPGILDVAIWGQMHRRDGGGTAWYNYFTTGIGSTDVFREINVSIFDSHTIPVFPFFGWAEGAAHETEGAAFAQHIGTKDLYFALGAHEEYADLYIFDWLFAQSRAQEEEELTLTFHLYTANQTILDEFGDYATDVVDGIPVIVVTVVPGTAATTWAGLEYVLSLGHIYGTAEAHGYAFWGWFDDELLDESGRTGAGLRRPALPLAGGAMCLLFALLDQLENATMEEAIALFDDGNIDLYGVWVRFGDLDDSSLVNMADLNLLQRHINFGHILPVYFSGAAGDVEVDGVVNMSDLSLLQRYTNFSHIITVVLGERPQ